MENEWIISDNSLEEKDLLKNESLFNVSNGYLGVRGNFEEKYPENYKTIRGTYINAFYEDAPIQYGEKAYAFPETMQKIVNVTDSQDIDIIINNEKFSVFQGTIKAFNRYVDIKKGCYIREIQWVSPLGKELKIKITRMASLKYLELFVINYEIEKVNFDEDIIIESSINGNVANFTDENDPRVGSDHAKILSVKSITAEKEVMQIVSETANSKNIVAVTTRHRCDAYNELSVKNTEKSAVAIVRIATGSKIINFTKYNVYTDSRRHENVESFGFEIAEKLSSIPFEKLRETQEEYLNKFWSLADINIVGDEKLHQGLKYNLYQLLQAVGKEEKSNITAKGLSGEGYEGHYFWDTEIYILPFFTLCYPELAKGLLRYRYNILDGARERAIEMGHKKGAAYPWRTIIGKECSSYFPAGTAQYHINGDIAYSYVQYYLATGDFDFVKEFGAEVIFETARIWLEIGHFDKDLFKIDAVTGPDEYTAIVNNNYYTNVMAKYNLKWAVKFYNELKGKDEKILESLSNKIGITEEEVKNFENAYINMYLPYNEELKINAQDDTFLSKAVWDFENTPKENYPLLLNYHPLTIYRYQVLKQADTVLAHFLVEDEADFSTIKNSYDYYEKLTTHDSSLSCAAYSIMASKVGYPSLAYKYFIETARLDLDDTHGNTKDGIHTANMGGTWMSIVYGFAGLRIKEDYISLSPKLPDIWNELSFGFSYKGNHIKVYMKKDKTVIVSEGNSLIVLKLNKTLYEITGDKKLEIVN
ncbi:glycoside hydrolase family 65 protein [Clostridium folliculivorans]|uniref:Glycosyl hydrolase n=1 Tax=Clostridium folliculivorans TaxID=2886038 RepID=A0A9W6DD19_9CLOT|nr:glycosyl hydrolase family 65 protein [Clostridium folliculivorans]GKU27526.1 glycosyl hydrolase [Clostridium folliculivorans]GKU32375.1 glycosyl hydrolase [Clostridium folliculivorans]